MNCQLIVNNKPITATQGETILDALRRNGVHIPTLCNIKEMLPTGACRLCMVEVKGQRELVPACSFPVQDNLIIETHSPIVTNARKTIVELLLARHPDDCLYCERNGNCELQTLAYELNVRERRLIMPKNPLGKDLSSQAIHRDPSKCVLCGRCVRICKDIIGCHTLDFAKRGKQYTIHTAFAKGMNASNCIHCGQCVIACPTAALTDKSNIIPLQKNLASEGKKNIALYDALLPQALQLYLGKKIKNPDQLVNGILMNMGFSEVRNVQYASDIYIQAVAHEFIEHLKKGEKKMFLSSFCPAFVKYAEQSFHDLLPQLATTKSPTLLYGQIAKTNMFQIFPVKDVFVAAFEPCTARKHESKTENYSETGFLSVDASLTFREFFLMLQIYGIQTDKINPVRLQGQQAIHSSASGLLSVPGGLITSVIRVLQHLYPKDVIVQNHPKVSGGKIYKKIQLKIFNEEVQFIALNGMKDAAEYIERAQLGLEYADFIELLACPNGCVNGGGIFVGMETESQIRSFTKTITDTDQIAALQNPACNEFTKEYFENNMLKQSGFNKTFTPKNII